MTKTHDDVDMEVPVLNYVSHYYYTFYHVERRFHFCGFSVHNVQCNMICFLKYSHVNELIGFRNIFVIVLTFHLTSIFSLYFGRRGPTL